MNITISLKLLARVAAVLTFSFCLFAGIYLCSHTEAGKDNHWEIGLGLYFIGKAFFVGPMLLVAAEQLDKKQNS